jgi:hypothetical protein
MLLAYEVDAMGPDTYWEIYTHPTQTYIATVESEDFGDYLAQHRAEKFEEIILFPQEPYQVMTDIHIELDKWWGQPDDHLDDCNSIHDPTTELGHFCQGCKAFAKWTEGKTYGDYYNMLEKRKKGYAYV